MQIARREGRALPDGVGVDRDGHPTTDPNAVLEGGALLPFGGHKGSSIAMMMEIMAAALAGGDYSFEIDWSAHPGAATPHGGQTYILVDPDRGNSRGFAARIETLVDAIHDAGQDRLPGDRRYANRRAAERLGIPIAAAISLISGRSLSPDHRTFCMHITRVDLYRAPMPMKVPFKIAIGVTTVSQSLFVRIHTDSGLVGVGEGNIFTPVVGETPDSVWGRGAGAGAGDARRRPARHRGARAADAQAAAGQHHAALGLRDRAVGPFGQGGESAAVRGAGRPAAADRHRQHLRARNAGGDGRASRRFKARGFQAIKVKLGTDLATDLERMRQIRAAVGPEMRLRIDANQGWSRVTAKAGAGGAAAVCARAGRAAGGQVGYRGSGRIAPRLDHPLMADESLFDAHDALRLVQAAACDYFNIKLAKAGGILAALRINAIGEAAGIPCMVGCMTDAGVAISAAVHLASARENIVFADLDGADMLAVDPVAGGFSYGARGELVPRAAPGLGVELDSAYLASLETRNFS